MFAMLGVMMPVLIGVDYVLTPKTQNEAINNKFYLLQNEQEYTQYHLYTESHHFTANAAFYDNAEIGDTVTYYYTPIFHTLTDVSRRENQNIYICKQFSVYGWPLIVTMLTLICSIVLLIRSRRILTHQYESVINLGVINAFLCMFTIILVLFHNLAGVLSDY
jgi:hypothetical protein